MLQEQKPPTHISNITIKSVKYSESIKDWLHRLSITVVIVTSVVLLTSFSTWSGFAEEPILVKSHAAAELSAGKWFNTPSGNLIKLADLKGKVTILHFWTLGCINCRRNLPSYNRWYKKFDPKQVSIIGVHTPETSGEASKTAVEKAVKRHGIAYPVLVDSLQNGHYTNWDRWNQHYWPTVYLIDKKGNVRWSWEGELEYDHSGGEAKMQKLVEKLTQEEGK